jgi:DNA-binding GntR family transcriptional regulator
VVDLARKSPWHPGAIQVNQAGLHERAFEHLRTMIVFGKLEPGAVLVESDLCEMLDVSRTPLREALKLLAAQGLVELRQNRSARIAPLRIDAICDLFETMSSIERLTLEFAAKRIAVEELTELRRLQDQIERFGEAGDLGGYFKTNRQILQSLLLPRVTHAA